MVALTVNNELLAEAIDGDNPKDDKSTADLQIDEIRDFVGRHNDFMEVAYSASDLRRIVGNDKLAVILGMEVDNIGNFNKKNVVCNADTVKAEVLRLYDKGVRYIFPIHVVDNKFGGTAVYEDLFNFANKYSTGSLFSIQSSVRLDPTITHRLGDGLDNMGNLYVKAALDAGSTIPFPNPDLININPFDSRFCPVPTLGCWDKYKLIRGLLSTDPSYITYRDTLGGHINSKGLTPLGEIAIREMMRVGIMIDIDHMSLKSINRTLEIAKETQYPVNIGHNGIRESAGSERGAARGTVVEVAKLGGMFGVGTSDSEEAHSDATSFIKNFESVWLAMDKKSVAMGTDVNGMERLPRASEGLDSKTFYSGFSPCRTGNRTWDYTKEGVAHYGLMSDFIRDIKNRNAQVYENLMKSSEYFAQMWEKCERLRTHRPEPIVLPLFRLYNGRDHFYTTSIEERDNSGYGYEKISCRVYPNRHLGAVPLFRLWNGHDHFYTTSTVERDIAISRGYSFEKNECYVFDAPRAGVVPLYRLFHSGNGDHFYTTDTTERDNASTNSGYVSEGIACYVFP